MPAAEIPARIGQAVEALESVPLLARALERAGVGAPVTGALGRLISGELPLDEWVALVRATVPPPRAVAPAPHAGLLAARGSRAARTSRLNATLFYIYIKIVVTTMAHEPCRETT